MCKTCKRNLFSKVQTSKSEDYQLKKIFAIHALFEKKLCRYLFYIDQTNYGISSFSYAMIGILVMLFLTSLLSLIMRDKNYQYKRSLTYYGKDLPYTKGVGANSSNNHVPKNEKEQKQLLNHHKCDSNL